MNTPYIEQLLSNRFGCEVHIYRAPPGGFPGDDWANSAYIVVAMKHGTFFKVSLADGYSTMPEEQWLELLINELAQTIHTWEAAHLNPAE